ncbi:MAG: hypothetical protein AAF296_07510 [Pseudomonadota bacterium]
MASRWRNNKNSQASTWRQALLFNALMLMLPVVAANTIVAAYTTSAITNPNSLEARAETRSEIDRTFKTLRGAEATARQDWASRIDQAVADRNFAVARGYLLAAPQMLNEADARAVRAATQAETSGTPDQRILRAALLFLPDPVRANYQRAISPPPQPRPETEQSGDEIEETTDEALIETIPDSETPQATVQPVMDLGAALPMDGRFAILGDREDLVRRSQSWLRGEGGIDTVQLRLRALGLRARTDGQTSPSTFEQGVTVIFTAKRANRLVPEFEDYLRDRIEDAMPVESLRSVLETAFEPVMTSSQRADRIITDYEAAIQPEALARFYRDMETVALLANITSTSGAITLIEQTQSPEDMRRILLVTRAGGDRAVALAQEIGPDILKLAQIGVKWTTQLVLQAMGIVAIGLALLLCAFSTLTKSPPLKPYSA